MSNIILIVIILIVFGGIFFYGIWCWIYCARCPEDFYATRLPYVAPKVYAAKRHSADADGAISEPEDMVVPHRMVLGHYSALVRAGRYHIIKNIRDIEGPYSVLCINESTNRIWTRMEQRSFSIESVVDVLMCNYEVDLKTAYHDSRALLRVLLKYGVVKELK